MTNKPRLNCLEEVEQFWSAVAKKNIHWFAPWQKVLQGSFARGDIHWFDGGKLNVSVNCIDRHLPQKANQPALLWEGDKENEQACLTFSQLHEEVSRMANVLKLLGIKKGDRIGIYLPQIPEAAIAMLACSRIGAVHTVIFAGFSAHALRQRLQVSSCKLLITADSYQRGGKLFSLKPQADEACKVCDLKTLIVKHGNTAILIDKRKDYWWHELKQTVSSHCEPEQMDAEDPLFILYTSGSTGQPKGIVHSTGGYLVQVAYTHQLIFSCSPGEVYWCTADVGWITGHSYVVYGPLANGICSFLFSGTPTWPDPARYWKLIDKYKIRVFYTAPTAIRTLKSAGEQWLASTKRESLRLLGSVGEPINPEVWQWYFNQVGKGQVPIVDTWWQTETGAIMICPQSNLFKAKPGAASRPLPGIHPVLLDDNGQEIQGAGEGSLAIKYPWPAMARTIAGDHARFCKTYLLDGYYITGDGAKRDEEGDYWITGRIDDVLNVSGHRLGTAEIESALLTHPFIAEAAVVGCSHPVKGQGIYAFVSLRQNYSISDSICEELKEVVKKEIGAIAKPDIIRSVADLPKTRSGKIMRRILRKIANNQVAHPSDLGDLSTLANPQVVQELLKNIAAESN